MKPLLYLFVALFSVASVLAKEEPTEITWDDLLPPEERQANLAPLPDEEVVPLFEEQGNSQDHTMPGMQTGSYKVVEELDGKLIRMPGFMLPLEYAKGGMVSEFLLVPYFGACIHVPPPPPNQIVYVISQKPIKAKGLWDPVWVTGKMSTKTNINDLGDAAYTLELTELEKYDE